MRNLKWVLLVVTGFAFGSTSSTVIADQTDSHQTNPNQAQSLQTSAVWAQWNKSNETNPAIIDHRLFDGFLKTYVVTNHPSGINRFRYADVSRRDNKTLKKYIKQLSSIDPRDFRKTEQKAYWLNLYNALTLESLLKLYPISALDHHRFSRRVEARVAGQKMTLADIEQRILRPVWGDYKLVFGLSCATLGCPAIHPQAFTAANTDKLLKQYVGEFINHPRGLVINKQELCVSKIFDWYRQDFGSDDRHLLRLFAHYADDNKALYILGFSGEITYAYDKRINAPETRWPL